MAETTSATADLRRKDMFYVPPEQLLIAESEDDILFDERAALPPAERMVKSVMVNGVIEPVVVRKNGPRIEVIDGRQRVKAAIEANRRLEKQGAETITVPVVFQKGDPGELASMIVLLNEIRQDDSILVKAKKAKRLRDRGRSEEQIMEAFGLDSAATLKNWDVLLDCTPKIQKLVDGERIRLTDARELAKLPMEEQESAAEKLMTDAPTRAARKANGDGPKKRVANPRSRFAKFLKFYAKGKDELPETKAWKFALVDWLMGEMSGAELAESCPPLAALTAKVKKGRPKKEKAA